MILSIIIILLLVISFKTGYYYGFVRSIVRMAGRFIVLLVATVFARPISTWLATTIFHEPATSFLFTTVTFAVLVAFGTMIWRHIERVMHIFNKIPLIGFFNRLAGSLVYVTIAYLMIYVILLVTKEWQIDWYQIQLQHSMVTKWMLTETPAYTTVLTEWISNQYSRIG